MTTFGMRGRALGVLCTALAVGMLGTPACKKGKETETPKEIEPTRPPSPSGTFSLRGYYMHAGTVGTFQDCTTGQRWRVAHEGDHAALEEAYLQSDTSLGTALLVTVEGGIDLRPNPDTGRDETMLIVARFVESAPGELCPGDALAPS